ncbi:SPFH domain-containing protein [Singulisphaera sp. Ch08]|uniref:SPFH domain-containing protein n=1 Tax=Singulisphaera sp. Ch08 TaxID=3120278 RepID=A0AAU7CGL2_9BACT
MDDLLAWPLKILEVVWKVTWRFAQQRPWAAAVALYGLARAFGIMIQSGQRGVLFRWGRAAKELEPGFHWLIPLIHGVKTTPVRSITLDLPVQKVLTADGLVYDVSVNVVYHVENATKALTLIDHLSAGCRTAVSIHVTEVLRVRDQAQLADRLTLDRELTERVQSWVARWGLVIEQAGFTSIAPNKGVLRTTQLGEKTVERARMLRGLIDGGLDVDSALVMIGTERPPTAKSSHRYHARSRRLAPRNAGVGRGNSTTGLRLSGTRESPASS